MPQADPDALLAYIDFTLAQRDNPEKDGLLDYLRTTLNEQLQHGSREPHWERHPKATRFIKQRPVIILGR